MNSKGFNQFKSFVNQGGSSSGGKGFLPLVLGFGLLWLAQSSIYYVDVGHYAIKFNKLFGLTSNRYREGYNFKLPFIETPIIFNVQTREDEIRAETANRDMQLVKLSVKVLFHPEVDHLHSIYTKLGKNYDQKVLPAICN